MHLKSLNLKGFKSFADRSSLSFEPGITAIVGPNGSGKSNISDAVLWVLGERNAKTLRGQAMEDVVFAGSSVRKPVGVAEVDLVLDNSDETLSLEFNEVVLTRRMYRNGESEYLINGVLARRMDVLDILHDTGLGVGTPSIISQGNLDSLLQSKPEDRRAIIEEAAGVLKHKQRKTRSERKLELMDQHLVRVKDIAAEVERQLKPLERKAKRALAYKDLAAELAELSLSLAVDDLRLLQKKWEEMIEQEKSLAQGLESAREKIDAAQSRMNSLQKKMREDSLNTGDLSRRYQRARSISERLESIILLLAEKQRYATSAEDEFSDKLQRAQEKLADINKQMLHFSQQLVDIENQRMHAQSIVDASQKEHEAVSSQRVELNSELESLMHEERLLVARIEHTRVALSDAREALSSNVNHEILVAARREELQSILEEERCLHESLLVQQQECTTRLEELRLREIAVNERVDSASAKRESVYDTYESLRDEVSVVLAEIKGLEELKRSRDSANPALAWLRENTDRYNDEIAQLSQIISAPPEWEKTVEWLLGGDLKALVVRDMQSANQIARILCERGSINEATLLPRKDTSSFLCPKKHSLPSLIDMLEYESGYDEVVTSLLGDVRLCETLEDAVKSHINDTDGLRFASRDGCLVWQNGKISVGMNAQDEEGILALHRLLEEAREKATKLQSDLEQTQEMKATADLAFEQARKESLNLSQERARAQGNEDALRDSLKRSAEKLVGLQKESKSLEEELLAARKILAGAEPASKEYEESIEAQTTLLESVKTKCVAVKGKLVPFESAIEEHIVKLTEARLLLATLNERDSSVRRQIETGERELKALRGEIDDVSRSLARKKISARRIKPLKCLFEEFSQSVKLRTGALAKVTHEAQSSTSGLHNALEEAREETSSAHNAHDVINEKFSTLRVEKGRLEIQVESAIRTIKDDCRTSLESALTVSPLEDRAEVEEQTFKLRRRIANMGTINPDAAVEYEELKTRFSYMEQQLDDMMCARRALTKIIRVIDNRMKEDFIRTFDQVNKHFQEVFAILFPGGSAELSLVNPEEPETTGIEVSAQPRGKRIAKMMLMSGGEKSLTALALLFAVYKARSAPFYILDEVEAALDDTNLRRLCGYFNSLRDTTQLILITHQRRTMELADVLYGVSMQADGVTRVVSQRLEHARVSKEA